MKHMKDLDEVFRVLRNTDMSILRDEMVECKGIQIIGVEYSFEYKPYGKCPFKT